MLLQVTIYSQNYEFLKEFELTSYEKVDYLIKCNKDFFYKKYSYF